MKERKYAVFSAALASLLLLNSINPILADDTTKGLRNQLKDIQGQLSNAHAKKTNAEAIIREITVKLATIQAQLDAANAELVRIHAQQAQVNQQMVVTKQELAVATQHLMERQQVLDKRVRAIYIHGQLNYLQVIMGAKDFSDFANRLELLKRVVRSDYSLLQEIRQQQAAIQLKKDKLEAQRRQLASLESDALHTQQKIAEKKAEQQEVMDEAKAQRAAAEQMEAELQASSNDIMRRIQAHEAKIRAQQEAARRQAEAAARAAKAAGRKAPPVPVYKPKVIGTGRLSRPCGGPVTSPFGYRIHPIFHTKIYHAGVDFGVPSGTPIHAADSGIVIYAGSGMRGYGNVVIIDHGGGLSTLYAHNSSLTVRAGQSVSKGQVIARAGSTGYATGPHCHFEVRRNGAPTNPMGYL
ncbi:murein hydrolase activator EnvC family protein [Allisonella histaminiformans]|uniref:murein hydrolase activator EnvC family protein n=1 Tax=Allisonella histaminiformans TaxID=209880 RepID=UPI002941D7C6|nr:peptidoglycan DD-metalloendopeptidase family protein [Allisonella histaminiformans]